MTCNKRLGINNLNPSFTLDVDGTCHVSGLTDFTHIQSSYTPTTANDLINLTFLTSNYITATTTSATYETITHANATYQPITSMTSYLTTATANDTYETIPHASATYQPITSMTSYIQNSLPQTFYYSNTVINKSGDLDIGFDTSLATNYSDILGTTGGLKFNNTVFGGSIIGYNHFPLLCSDTLLNTGKSYLYNSTFLYSALNVTSANASHNIDGSLYTNILVTQSFSNAGSSNNAGSIFSNSTIRGSTLISRNNIEAIGDIICNSTINTSSIISNRIVTSYIPVSNDDVVNYLYLNSNYLKRGLRFIQFQQ